ncbi:MAG: PAS domain S-box protein [Candidatus Cloacimonetes bacterium]|nr:PAS domain S-box protein [Candidatus Cloacimonadota bacterium]
MFNGIFFSLVYNAALLLALAIIFDSVTSRDYRNLWWSKVLSGISLGMISLAIMINPWELFPGVVFDTRSILFSIVGMFFGIIPALISASMAVAYRICLGGSGALIGVSIIVTSVLWGYVWKIIHSRWTHPYGFLEFLSLGIATHITMAGLAFMIPTAQRIVIVNAIALPVLVIYPIVTVILGRILVRRLELREKRSDLEHSERQFRSLYENAPMAYQSVDDKGTFLTVNKTWLNIMGYELDEVVGKKFSSLLHPDCTLHFQKCFADFKALGHSENVEYTLIKKDGNPIVICLSGNIVADDHGRFLQTQCVFTDITERKKQEDELLKSKSDWEAIFQSIPHPVYILDKDQNIVAANAYLEKAIGKLSTEMSGKKCWEIMHGDEAHEPHPGCPFAENCDHDNNVVGEIEVAALGGWYLVSCKPVYDKNGNIDKVIHIAMDITERKKAELIIAESEEKYRLLTETAQDIILVHDLSGKLSYANQKALNFMEISPEQLSSVNIYNYITEKYHPMLAEQGKQREQGYTGTRIYQMELHNSTTQKMQVEVSSTPIIIDNQFSGILAVIRDVTERLADQQAIQDSEARFQLFMDNLPGGAFIKDSLSTVLYVNKYLKDLHNSDRKIGLRPLDFYTEDVAKITLAEDQQTLRTGFLNIVEKLVLKDGTTHLHETTKFTIPNLNGEAFIGGITMDVTQRIQAEEQLNRYAKRLKILRKIDSIVLETLSFETVSQEAVKSLQELIPFTVLTLNVLAEEYITVRTLLKPEKKFGYLVAGMRYQPDEKFFAELKSSKTVIINDAAKTTIYRKMNVRAALVNDGIKSIMCNALMVQDKFLGYIGFSSSELNFFTEEHKEIAVEFANQVAIVLLHLQLLDEIKQHSIELEHKVDERTKQLSNSNQELEAFSYSVAHDLRAPLRTIDGYCNILIEDHGQALEEDAQKLLNIIRDTSHRMDTLIKELLGLAKLTRNTLNYTKVSMQSLATEICNEVVGAQFSLTIDSLPDCYADNSLIRQVWQNLIENAVKFTLPCEQRQIHIGFEKLADTTVYFVKDSGVGFNMEFVSKIFIAFQRLHRESEFQGTGIGLAIVKKIIDRHNGKVWAESTLGEGSTLFFSLPNSNSDFIA